jgi:hypothetical protein
MKRRVRKPGGALRKAVGGTVGKSDPRQFIKFANTSSKTPSTMVSAPANLDSYGSGPEHSFFGRRAIPSLEGWSPVRDPTLTAPKSGRGSNGSDWMTAAGLAMIGGKLVKDARGGKKNPRAANPNAGYDLAGIDTEELHRRASDTSSLNAWGEDYLSSLEAPSLDGWLGTNDESTAFWNRMDNAARDTSYLDQTGEEYLASLSAPELAEIQSTPGLWERIKGYGKGAMGALGLYSGVQQGGAAGYGRALEGAGSLADMAGYEGAGGTLGSAGQVLSGINQGGVKGYGKAAVGATELANQAGYSVPGTEMVSNALGPALALYGAYTGLEGVSDAYHAGSTKNAAISGASAGASAGSLLGPVGAGAGAIIGGTLGILYTGAGGNNKMTAANEAAWDAFRKNTKNGAQTFRESGFPLTQAFQAADNATGYKELDKYMRAGSKSKVEPQLAARNMMIKELERAQAEGRLPANDAELRNVNGVGFFEKEIAPKIWGDKKVDPDLVKLMGHQMDNIFHYGKEGYTEKQMDWKNMDSRGLAEMASNPSSSYYQQAQQELNRREGRARGGVIRKASGGLTSMVPRRTSGALSAMVPRQKTGLDDPRSYYRYGAQPQPVQPPPQMPPPMAPQMPVQRAMGGGLALGYNAGGMPGTSRLVRGPGTGRSDEIPARLSDGEYVFDAETVALLGDGSTDEGARRLDALRQKLRMHKGRQLAKGKFSSSAKNPEDYLE